MGADAPLVSRLQHVADILQAQTLRFTVSVSFPFIFAYLAFSGLPSACYSPRCEAAFAAYLHSPQIRDPRRTIARVTIGAIEFHRLDTECMQLGARWATWSRPSHGSAVTFLDDLTGFCHHKETLDLTVSSISLQSVPMICWSDAVTDVHSSAMISLSCFLPASLPPVSMEEEEEDNTARDCSHLCVV